MVCGSSPLATAVSRLIIVTSQYGQRKINVYGFGHMRKATGSTQ